MVQNFKTMALRLVGRQRVEPVRGLRERLTSLVVVLADLAATSARDKPKTPPDSKTNYAPAFFDSIDP
jgi:hypothetical protein